MSKKHNNKKANRQLQEVNKEKIEKIETKADAIDNTVTDCVKTISLPQSLVTELDAFDEHAIDELEQAIVNTPAFNTVHASVNEIEQQKEKDTVISELKDLTAFVKEQDVEPTHKLVIKRLQKAGAAFYSNSNISDYINDEEREDLIDEATEAYAKFMECLCIDPTDSHAADTPRRVAKAFINDLIRGRFYPAPKVTAFPNRRPEKETGFNGLLVVRADVISMCAHHHLTVKGQVYIGVVPNQDGVVIGLSKYIRIAQHVASVPSVQENLTEDIADAIIEATGTDDCAIMMVATHNCVSCRGTRQNDSTTMTTTLRGQFMADGVLRKEFHDNVQYQRMNER